MKKSAKKTARTKVIPPIRVSEEEADAYREKCDRTGESLSEVIRRLLNRWVRK